MRRVCGAWMGVKARRIDEWVSSGKKDVVYDWYQSNGTRNQAVNGVPYIRPGSVWSDGIRGMRGMVRTVVSTAVEVDMSMLSHIIGDRNSIMVTTTGA